MDRMYSYLWVECYHSERLSEEVFEMIDKVPATVISLDKSTSKYWKATLDVEGYGILDIDVIPYVNIGDLIFVSGESVIKAIIEKVKINEELDPIVLNKILSYLQANNIITNIDGRTYRYDYDSENNDIFFRWGRNYSISEDEGNIVFDYDSDHNMIGVEILHFDLEDFLRTGVIPR
jgi:hypothetical protein